MHSKVVVPYSDKELLRLFSTLSTSSENLVAQKKQFRYLIDYLRSLNISRIVVEQEYVDRDFLEDYSGYYVRCFNFYQKKCSRLHFFACEFENEDFTAYLNGGSSKINIDFLQEGYRGFVVIKKLPHTFIGRSCISPPRSIITKKSSSPMHKYHVHLFGFTLRIESLAFQEQDRVVAACATCALWTSFHKTGRLFHHPILSPMEITKAATKDIQSHYRTFPNDGLSIDQIARAIKEVGLEPLCYIIRNMLDLQMLSYAYIRYGLPIVFPLQLLDKRNSYATPFIDNGHAVTICGFDLEHTLPSPIGDSNFILKASRINTLIVHDDQVGPFTEMRFDDIPIILDDNTLVPTISTNWPDIDNNPDNMRAYPEALVIPVYHKIRIPYFFIFENVLFFDLLIKTASKHESLNISEQDIQALHNMEWDIFLTDVTMLKEEVLEMTGSVAFDRTYILTKSLPRFLWRATALQKGKPVFDLIFDATDIQQGKVISLVIEYDAYLSSLLHKISQFLDAIPQKGKSCAWNIAKYIAETPSA